MAGVGNPNLKGNKNSGRKPFSEEIIKVAKERLYKDIFKELIPAELIASKHLELLTAVKKTRKYSAGKDVIETEEVDLNSVSKGIDMAYKLRGDYAPEKVDHTTKGESLVDTSKIDKLTKLANLIRKQNG